jgi:cyclopropane-fatty-acyl-phospholipid synthase
MEKKRALLSRGVQRFLDRSIGTLKRGRLEMFLPNGELISNEGEQGEWHGVLEIKRWRTFNQLMRRGDIGFAEAYVRGDWDSPDLTGLMCTLADNLDSFTGDFGAQGLDRIWTTLQHALRRNSKKQSSRNIEAHYDLGNTFYELWLDSTMTYSSALFVDKTAELEAAQRIKYQRILDQADLSPGSHILEIGCGWGGFAEFAVEAGHRVTGITISPAQLAFASQRLDSAIHAGAAELVLQDYRDLRGRFDAIVSIEMFEAVGKQWWGSFMQTLKRNLKPGGKAVVQTIHIKEDLFEGYNKRADFIQTYIFPGGMLPSPDRFTHIATQAGLACRDIHHFGASYAETLKRWQKNFNEVENDVRSLGFDTEFMRLWNFYFSYCISGFDSGRTGVAQYTLQAAR